MQTVNVLAFSLYLYLTHTSIKTMNYPAPNYVVAGSSSKTTIIKIAAAVGACVVVLFILAALGIGLGVGLGVGLTRHSSSSSSDSGGSAASASTTTATSVLSAPTVNCVYSSSTCGCAATQPSFILTRIINGYSAVANSWPWIVALYINNGQSFCGGFRLLINML